MPLNDLRHGPPRSDAADAVIDNSYAQDDVPSAAENVFVRRP